MPPRSELARTLALVARDGDWGGYSVAEFMRHAAEDITSVGILTAGQIDRAQGMANHRLGPEVLALLSRRHAADLEARRATHRGLADNAARKLASTARWEGEEVHLAIETLLGELVVDASRPLISFDRPEAEPVLIPRRLLADAGRALRPFPDVSASVDARGLHLRWRDGRGGMNLTSQPPPAQWELVLHVVLERPRARRPGSRLPPDLDPVRASSTSSCTRSLSALEATPSLRVVVESVTPLVMTTRPPIWAGSRRSALAQTGRGGSPRVT